LFRSILLPCVESRHSTHAQIGSTFERTGLADHGLHYGYIDSQWDNVSLEHNWSAIIDRYNNIKCNRTWYVMVRRSCSNTACEPNSVHRLNKREVQRHADRSATARRRQTLSWLGMSMMCVGSTNTRKTQLSNRRHARVACMVGVDGVGTLALKTLPIVEMWCSGSRTRVE
jgi:hypothetical protein